MGLNIAIFGASGFGKFHAREFSLLGCNVVAILGTTEKSARETSENLKNEFGINVSPYSDLTKILEREELDAIAICSPPETHYDLTKAALDKNIHVLCEKPLVASLGEAKELFLLANRNDLILTENTQWPSVLEDISFDSNISRFEMRMQPNMEGEEMLKDGLPHTNSMLIKLVGVGTPKNINLVSVVDEHVLINFDYLINGKSVFVKYFFDFKVDRPRALSFKINNRKFERLIGANYSQKLITGRSEISIKDPLKKSVEKFINAIKGRTPSLVDEKEMLANLRLREEIIVKYKEHKK